MNIKEIFKELSLSSEFIINSMRQISTDAPEHKRVMDRIFTPAQVAELLQVSRPYLSKLAKERKDEFPEPIWSNKEKTRRAGWTLEGLHEIQKLLGKHPSLEANKRKIHTAVLSIFSNKGGVGKTTTTVNVAEKMAILGQRVLLIDLDPQGSLTHQFECSLPDEAIRDDDGSEYILSYYLSSRDKDGEFEFVHIDDEGNISYELLPNPKNIIHNTHWSGIDIIPATDDLSTSDFDIPARGFNEKISNYLFFNRISSIIEKVKDSYDIVLIDLPPNVSYLAVNALYASQGIIIPIRPQALSVHSTQKFSDRFGSTMEVIGTNDELKFAKILISETRSVQQIEDEEESESGEREDTDTISAAIRLGYKNNLLKSEIGYTEAIKNAGFKNIYETSPSTIAGSSKTLYRAWEFYDNLTDEILSIISETIWEIKE